MKMKMNNAKLLIAAVLVVMFSVSCTQGNKGKTSEPTPLNISVIVDLSDRLINNPEQPQMERDTAIIGYLCDAFKKATLGPQILKSRNKMRVIFYPTPNIPNVNVLAKSLNLDVSVLQGVEKRKGLEAMKSTFVGSLQSVYDQAISQKKWLGCDIWDFFSSGKAKTQCVEQNARNIVFILTDGFLYHSNTKIREGDAYSYVLPQTLQNNQSSLIVRRNDLQDLEVMILEVNAKNVTQRDKLTKVLSNWLEGMGVSHYAIEETALTIQTSKAIDIFLQTVPDSFTKNEK